MIKKIILAFIFITSLYANEKPVAQFVASGSVTDIVYKENRLYAATDAGSVDIFDLKTQELLKQIKVPQTIDFMGDLLDSKVYSVDVLHEKVLLLSQGNKGARRVHLFEKETLELVLPDSLKLFIAKAKFLDESTIILGLLSNEIISYDIQTKKINYKVQVSQSKFSDFVLTEDKSSVIIADESGALKIHDIQNGAFIEKLSGQNLDNVFQVDTKNGVIATAGQDRRIVVYKQKEDISYYKTSDFLIYSVGLSPSGKVVGYSSDEQNNITLFHTETKKELGVFEGNKMTPTNILFINEVDFFVSSDDNHINKFKIQ